MSERGEEDGSTRRPGGKQIEISSVEQEEPGKRAGRGRGGVGGGERGAVVDTGGGLNRGDIADGGRESDAYLAVLPPHRQSL